MGLDSTMEGWMPKIRIINFDPTRNQGDKSIKTGIADPNIDDPEPSQDTMMTESSTEQGHRNNDPPLIATAPQQSSLSPAAEQPFVPQVLMFNDTPIFPSDPLYPLLTCAKFCENCHTSETSYWRTDDTGKDHCNPCGLHWTKHRLPRPIIPSAEPTSGKLMNLACQICPTRKHARRREEYRGVILCNACTDYWKRNNAVRPLIAFAKRPKGDRSKEAGATRQTKKCANCGTGRSSRWMIGPDGEDNCSECGLFWMYHNMRRPLGVGVGVDVIGPKRETRGPKIMESRKRRLGSVNTGSGSESENEESEDMKMDVQDSGQKGNDGGSEIDSPEPPDDSPVSLLNLVILARKIQCTSPQLLSNI
jgi:GATA zinc finger